MYRFFFVLVSRNCYRANSKHLMISASMFFNLRTFAKRPIVFLLASYQLSTLASLFIHISFLSTGLFLHTSPLRASSVISRHLVFLILVSLVQPTPLSTSRPWAVWHKASAMSSLTSDSSAASFVHLCSHHGSKIFCDYIIFRSPTQSLWLHSLPAYHAPNSRSISAVFCLP